MKNWYKFLALGLVCGLATTVLVACGPKLDATIDKGTNNNQTINRQPDNQTNENQSEDSAEQQTIDPDNHTINDTNENNQEAENTSGTGNQHSEQNSTENPSTPEPCQQHNFAKWTIYQDATCSTTGIEESFCTVCGIRSTRSIPTNDKHKDKIEVFEPTCTEAGYTLHTCPDCGASYTTDHVTTLDHDYDHTIIPATCHSVGYETFTCKKCGDEYVNELPITGHTFDETTHRCTVCGLFQDPIENLDHSKWYLKTEDENDWSLDEKKWAIILNQGNYVCYKAGNLLEDGTYEVNYNKPNTNYSGTYQISKVKGVYHLTLINTKDNGAGTVFELTYQVVTDPATQKVHYTFNKSGVIFFDNGYQNSTLVFGGYEL